MNDSLVGKKIKRLSDSKEITIRSEKEINGETVYSDAKGNIYTEDELDIRYSATPWYLMFEALHENGLVRKEVWNKHSNMFKCAFEAFMESITKAGYIAENKEV